jgi:UDP-N-acetylenolpyruvoylglucosamine reductase
MMMHEPLRFTGLRGQLSRDASLARFTSWRSGGRADILYIPADRDDLAAFVRQLPASERIVPLGLGSNTLIRDGGVRGTVVILHNPGAALAVADGLIYVDAGVACPKLARFAALHSRADAEFLAGIPGTIGGALAMNAGCYGGETWRFVARVEVLLRDGTFVVRTPDQYLVGYRSVLRHGGSPLDGIFTAAWFRFREGDAIAARARIKELLARRIAAQPLGLPNAGSVFRNPPGDHAARLIESCGLKGHVIGGARVSEKHANFIVNPEGQAKAADIEALIAHVRNTVRAKTGIDLQTEVRVIGDGRTIGDG